MEILQRFNPGVAALRPYEPGRPIEEVARELGLDPRGIIKLASNESALGPSPAAIAAMREVLTDVHRYPDGGAYLLRQALAAHYGLERSQIVVGNGSNEILELVGHCFMSPQTSSVYSQHAFIVYKLVTQLFGARHIEVPVQQGYRQDLEALAEAICDDTSVVFLCSPNNPTGTTFSAADLATFMARVPPQVLVVLDEAYAEIALEPPLETLQYVRDGRAVLITRTFSKAYGLAGLRLGYGLAPAPLAEALQQARQPFNVNLVAQAAGVAALADQDFVARGRQLYADGRDTVEAACRRLGLDFVRSAANFMLIAVGDGAGISKGLQARGVIVRPVDGYALPHYIRVNYGTAAENQRLIEALTAELAAR